MAMVLSMGAMTAFADTGEVSKDTTVTVNFQ